MFPLNASGYPREAWEVEACDATCRELAAARGMSGGWAAVAEYGFKIGASLLDTDNKKDPERLKANADAYRMAVAGDQLALEYLKYRSGRYGTYNAPADSPFAERYGTPIGGWATDVAKDDAFRLYQSALAVYGIVPEEMPDGSGGQPSGAPSGGSAPPVTYAGAQPLPGVTVTGRRDSLMPLVLLGGALLIFAMPKGRR